MQMSHPRVYSTTLGVIKQWFTKVIVFQQHYHNKYLFINKTTNDILKMFALSIFL